MSEEKNHYFQSTELNAFTLFLVNVITNYMKENSLTVDETTFCVTDCLYCIAVKNEDEDSFSKLLHLEAITMHILEISRSAYMQVNKLTEKEASQKKETPDE